jgi:electron transport complex protein RnfG
MSETPGLGSKTQDPKFLDQYRGKKGPFTVVKGSAKAEGEIVAVSGATISSKAVTNGVFEAVKTATAVLGS